jgi:hypothetical protein
VSTPLLKTKLYIPRVLSTECSLCQTCISVCAKDALRLSFAVDVGGKELLREKGPQHELAPGLVATTSD